MSYNLIPPSDEDCTTVQCWRAVLTMAAKIPTIASHLLRRIAQILQALRPTWRTVASTVTGATLLAGTVLGQPAQAYTVNSTADNSTVDGSCTLREAIGVANANTPTADCPSAGTPDTINLTGVSGTITLGSAMPSITDDVTLNGPGADNLTIDGNTHQAITATQNITINNLTIYDFLGSGFGNNGLYTRQTATVNGSTIVGEAYGVYADEARISNSNITGYFYQGVGASSIIVNNSVITGPNNGVIGQNVTVRDSTVTGYSNGVTGFDTVIVSDSTITGQTGTGVGGSNKVTVTNSVVSGEDFGVEASSNGSAIVKGSTITGRNGEGVYAYDGDIQLLNSTVTGSGAAGVHAADNNADGADVTIVNSTIFNNGGFGVHNVGESNGGSTTLQNSLIISNTTSDVNCPSGAVTSNGANLLGNSSACAALAGEVTTLPVANIIETTLALNGAPAGSPQSHALIASSSNPAFNAGVNADASAAGLTTDQRGSGFARISGGTVDIGAFEWQLPAAVGGVAEYLMPPHAAHGVWGFVVAVGAMLSSLGVWLLRKIGK